MEILDKSPALESNGHSERDKMDSGAWMAWVVSGLLTNYQNGHHPSKRASVSKLYKLSDYLRDTAIRRQLDVVEQGHKHSKGVTHHHVMLDRAELAFLVACCEDYYEPTSCLGLTGKLRDARDSLAGHVEEDESSPEPRD